MKRFILILLLSSITGCLETRWQLSRPGSKTEQQKMNAETVESLEADYKIKINELETELRDVYGRLEGLEHEFNSNGQNESSGARDALIDQIRILTSSVSELEFRINTIEDKLKIKSNSPLNRAERFFRQKKWSEAIIEYEKYREQHKNKDNTWAEATYKIGLCFQNMNLHREAASFYQEVIDNRASSPAANEAKKRLLELQ